MHTSYTTTFALWFLPLIAVASVGLYYLLKNKSLKLQLIPFFAIALVVVVGEIFKQIFAFNQPSYDMFFVPLHISSIPIFSFALCLVFKQGSQISRIFWSLSLNAGCIISLLVVFYPTIIFGDAARELLTNAHWLDFGTFISLHSIVVHYLYVMFVVLIFLFRPFKIVKRDILFVIGIFVLFVALAAIVATVTQTDFMRILTSPVPFLESLGKTSLILMQLGTFVFYLVGFSIFAFGLYPIFKDKGDNKR